jgi:hypothetical protein
MGEGVPVDRTRLAQPVGHSKRERVAFPPAQNRRRNLAVDPGRRGLAAIDRQRRGADLELKFGAAEDRRRRGKRAT